MFIDGTNPLRRMRYLRVLHPTKDDLRVGIGDTVDNKPVPGDVLSFDDRFVHDVPNK